MSLTNKTIAATYKDLLHLNNTNLGLTGTSKAVVDGLGNSTGLHLSTNKIIVKPSSNGVDSFSVQELYKGCMDEVENAPNYWLNEEWPYAVKSGIVNDIDIEMVGY